MLKLPCGGILPEFHIPLSEVDVWVMVSLFIHVTVVPRDTTIGFGLNAVVVSRLAPETITTVEAAAGDGLVGAGEGFVGAGFVGVVVELLLLLPQLASTTVATSAKRR